MNERSPRATVALPTFLVIGAESSGTTSLYQYLRQHPQIFMSPIKEPNFFAYDEAAHRNRHDVFPIRSFVDYQALFFGVRGQRAIGEASTTYLYCSAAPDRIKEALPGVRLIAMLRDPVERAHTAYLTIARAGREKRTFAQVVRDARNGEACVYVDRGAYHGQLARYADRFARDQWAVYLFDDYKRDPISVLHRIFRFLDVDDAFVPDVSVKHNVSGLPKSKLLERLLRRNSFTVAVKRHLPDWARRTVDDAVSAIHRANRVKPTIDPEIRQELIALYRDDILKLQDLIRQDLTAWLR
jgi:hypothetical protein